MPQGNCDMSFDIIFADALSGQMTLRRSLFYAQGGKGVRFYLFR